MSLILSGTDGLSDVDGSAATPAIRGTDANTGIFFPAADTIAFSEGGVESMRIDSSGNVGIGTASPSAPIDVVSNSSAIGTRIRGRTSDNYGVLEFTNNGASAETARLAADTSGNIIFSNTGSVTERMRIDSSGNLLVGTAANAITAYTASKSLVQSADYSGAVACLLNSTSTTGVQYFLAFGRGASVCGQITSGSTNSTSYTTSSDYRLKKDVQPITGALAKVQALKPCAYKWIEDDTTSEGFIAHELAETFPQAVVGEKDAVNAEGNPVYQGVDTSFLVATLTAAIQEQQTLIQSLTTRITALEAK
jgi:hypothetical protein